jgi:hypothetical protein
MSVEAHLLKLASEGRVTEQREPAAPSRWALRG